MWQDILLYISLFIAAGGGVYLSKRTIYYRNKYNNERAQRSLDSQEADSRYRSATIKFGQFYEKVVPLFGPDIFQDPSDIHFLGEPIDYLIFNQDKIIFVEVKTGNSRLNKRQLHIRKLVNEGKIEFKEVRH